MPVKKEILYPIFLECCKYASNDYWKYLFEDMAYGIMPYGIYISKEFLCCNLKGKEFSYNLQNKEHELLYQEITFLFSKKLNLFSKEEEEQRKIDAENFQKDDEPELWSDIKRKDTKIILIEDFAIEMKKKYNLSLLETKNLISLINTGITFKNILPTDIIYKNKIISIQGLVFENNKFYLKNNNTKITKNSGSNEKDTKKLQDKWSKYLATLN